jgi:hypothetical protein
MTGIQRFPEPWRIVEMSDRFAVLDATGHSVAFFHFTNRPDAAESAIDLFKKQCWENGMATAETWPTIYRGELRWSRDANPCRRNVAPAAYVPT